MTETALAGILRFAVAHRISDVHLRPGQRPVYRRFGALVTHTAMPELSAPQIGAIVQTLVRSPHHKEQLETTQQADLSFGLAGLGRFRINIYRQKSTLCLAIRVLRDHVPPIRDLNLPPVLERIALARRGLILVTGTTGSGKTTALAAMVDHINNSRQCHILTIEDPIEYLIADGNAIVSQREVGTDTPTFASALRGALRQDPDVILIGEMRDLETIESALLAAETGHLVLSTLHTLDAAETVNRIVMQFPPYHQGPVRAQLATILQAVVSLRLIPHKDGEALVPACEILVASPHIQEALRAEASQEQLRVAMAKGHTTYGMQTFDQSIMHLFQTNKISRQEALRQASNPRDFELRLSGISGTDQVDWDNFVLSDGDRRNELR